jgi:hypothetical protein
MQLSLTDPRLIASAIVLVLVVIIAIAIYLRDRRRTTEGLRTRFGREYDRAVVTHGSERKAEAKLADRESRVEAMKLRDLALSERDRFVADWQTIQLRFVDHPKGALTEADELVAALLLARGYPAAPADQRAADISVNHPTLVEYYRSAHAVAARAGKDETTTEELRAALVQFRSIFDELVYSRSASPIKAVA